MRFASARAALFEELLALKSQAWLSGTDKALFAPLLPHAQCYAVASGGFSTKRRAANAGGLFFATASPHSM